MTFMLLRQNTRQKGSKEENIEFGSQFSQFQRVPYMIARMELGEAESFTSPWVRRQRKRNATVPCFLL